MTSFSLILAALAGYFATLAFMLIVVRPLFMAYNRHGSPGKVSFSDFMQSSRHGVSSDIVVTGYLSVIPLLVLWLKFNMPGFPAEWILFGYTIVAALIVSLITVSDTALYDFWHFKIDKSVLSYLKHPKAAFASVSAGYMAVGIMAIIIVAVLYFIWLTSIYCQTVSCCPPVVGVWIYIFGNLLFAVILAALAVGVRGLRIRPNNPTMVIFSDNAFLNHSALNSIFSFVYSLGDKEEYAGKFRFRSDTEAVSRECADLYPTVGAPKAKLLNTDRPNILFIVWESLHAKFVKPEITPNLCNLANEGVQFTDMQCGSFLTDRGLACIFSGLPGQPTASIGKYTKKLPNLPAIPRKLSELGYITEVIHGGDLSVRQKADFYQASGHHRLVSIADFPRSAHRCKWGVHDDVTLERVYTDIEEFAKSGKPWMITLQTLSSHEPFEVPERLLSDKMANAFAYTDACLGRFIDWLKASPEWDNTLIVICADHGVHYGSEFGTPLSPTYFPHIGCVITGGAVKGPMKIDALVSQTDLPATILAQMGLDHSDFPFSRDVFADTYKEPFTFQASHHLVVTRDTEGTAIYNTDTDTFAGDPSPLLQRRTKAVLQQLYTYLTGL